MEEKQELNQISLKTEMRKAFYKKSSFWLLIVLAFLIGRWSMFSNLNNSESSAKNTIVQNVAKKENSAPENKSNTTTTAISSNENEVNKNITESEMQKDDSIKQDTPKSENSKQENISINKSELEKIKNVNENDTYAKHEVLRCDDKILFGLENYRTSFDDGMLTLRHYYLIIDFSIMNISKDAYESSYSDFSLMDDEMYSYEPTTLYNCRGSISGTVNFKQSKRGEIAFEVPGTQTKFILQFRPNLSSNKVVNFEIDVTPKNNKQTP